MGKVTVIPATKDMLTKAPINRLIKRRVAGYARVSTDSDEQYTSYEAQVDYYTKFIKSHDDWEFVRVYTDEGISGLNTKKREGFNEMINDALAGKIDLIITKSVSRFARNTVDSLVTIRQLKEKGVECYFEKENIYTFDGKGELLLTIMSSLAQEESRSISENVTWGHRRSFEEGKVRLPYKNFLGYRKGPDGKPEIEPEQSKLVLRIYDMFMSGLTPSNIAKRLTAEGIPTPAGKTVWQASTIESILTNEKYKGDALLQKKFTTDFLQKKSKVNEGEVPQYYVEGSHPPIISPEMFDRVQIEIARRKAIGGRYSGRSIFSCKLICGQCGDFYGHKTWNSTDKYCKQVWQCNSKFKNHTGCKTPHLTDESIEAKFLEAFNQLIPDKERLLDDCRMMQAALTDTSEIDRELETLAEEMEVVTELIKKCIDENSRTAQDQDEYLTKYNGLVERYDNAKSRTEALKTKRMERIAKAEAMGEYMFRLHERDCQLELFDDRLWLDVVENVTVYKDRKMKFKFRDDTEITV